MTILIYYIQILTVLLETAVVSMEFRFTRVKNSRWYFPRSAFRSKTADLGCIIYTLSASFNIQMFTVNSSVGVRWWRDNRCIIHTEDVWEVKTTATTAWTSSNSMCLSNAISSCAIPSNLFVIWLFLIKRHGWKSMFIWKILLKNSWSKTPLIINNFMLSLINNNFIRYLWQLQMLASVQL